MKYSSLFKMLPVIFLLAPAVLRAETADTSLNVPKKNPSLEEMSADELRAALKKSHSEIESRLGSGMPDKSYDADGTEIRNQPSHADKHAYEASVQSQLDILDYKIQSLENNRNKDRSSAASDAYKLKDIKTKIQELLFKIKSDNTESWQASKQTLDNLLRQVSYY